MSPQAGSEVGEQLAFDIETMIDQAAVEAVAAWSGAPLHFTTGHYSPAELDAAFEHWRFLHQVDATPTHSRMWHRAIAVPGGVEVGEHAFDFFTADLRCDPWEHPEPHQPCSCVGDLVYLAICEPCGRHVIAGDENSAVEGWHDHVFPGWRELPIVPARVRQVGQGDKVGFSKAATKWIEDHYPPGMQVLGAPVITERSSGGTRHVPRRSPWRGYDISHTAIDPSRRVEPPMRRRTTDASAPARAVTTQPAIGLGD